VEKAEQNMGRDNIQKSSALLSGRSPTGTSKGTLPLRPSSWGNWTAWTVLLASLFITFVIWYFARGVTMERGHDYFVFRTHAIESALRERLRAYEFMLRGGASLIAASEEAKRAQWQTYVKELQIDKYCPGVQGLGFSKLILPSEKETHIRQIHEEGFPNYDIQPDEKRPEYNSIIFLEPFDWRNQRAFGYDMFSEPTRKEAMVKTRNTGLATVSGKVILLQETDKDVQTGFLMYFPVYRKGERQETPEQRRKALMGYVYSPFRMNDFMRGILTEKHGYVELNIFDGDEPLEDALLFHGGDTEAHLSPSQSDRPHFFKRQYLLEYAGRSWLLVFESSRHLEETIDTRPVNTILLLGVVISLLLFSVLLSLTKSRNQARSLANISLDLERVNLGLRKKNVEVEQATDALGESEEKFRHLFNRVDVGMFRTRLDGSEILDMNKKLLDIFGRIREEMQGLPSAMLGVDPSEREEMLRSLEIEGRVLSFEGRVLNKQGEVRECLISLELFREQGILEGTIVDITGRNRAEDLLRANERLLSESQRLGHIGSFFVEFSGTLQWSDELYRLYGVSPETFTPTVESFLGLIHPDDREAMHEWIADVEAGEKPDAFDFRIHRPDGTLRYVRGWGEVVLGIENRPIYMAGTVQDVTERKLADQELQQHTAELAKRNRELQDALADIKQLTGMVPICSSCKKIRDDSGYWQGFESYISKHSMAVFSHGLCPECEKKMYEDLEKLKKENG